MRTPKHVALRRDCCAGFLLLDPHESTGNYSPGVRVMFDEERVDGLDGSSNEHEPIASIASSSLVAEHVHERLPPPGSPLAPALALVVLGAAAAGCGNPKPDTARAAKGPAARADRAAERGVPAQSAACSQGIAANGAPLVPPAEGADPMMIETLRFYDTIRSPSLEAQQVQYPDPFTGAATTERLTAPMTLDEWKRVFGFPAQEEGESARGLSRAHGHRRVLQPHRARARKAAGVRALPGRYRDRRRRRSRPRRRGLLRHEPRRGFSTRGVLAAGRDRQHRRPQHRLHHVSAVDGARLPGPVLRVRRDRRAPGVGAAGHDRSAPAPTGLHDLSRRRVRRRVATW